MVPDYVHEQAVKAAEALQAQLEERLLGTTHPGSSNGKGPSTVIEVSFPSIRAEIARHSEWRCVLQNGHGARWETPLSTFISELELYPLFRNAFAGVQVQYNFPGVILCNDSEPSDCRRFTPSKNTRRVILDHPVSVRPVGDLTQSPWSCACISFFQGEESGCCCLVEPHAFLWVSRRSDQFLVGDVKVDRLPTFYIEFANGEQPCYIPIARVFGIGPLGMTVELDANVVEF